MRFLCTIKLITFLWTQFLSLGACLWPSLGRIELCISFSLLNALIDSLQGSLVWALQVSINLKNEMSSWNDFTIQLLKRSRVTNNKHRSKNFGCSFVFLFDVQRWIGSLDDRVLSCTLEFYFKKGVVCTVRMQWIKLIFLIPAWPINVRNNSFFFKFELCVKYKSQIDNQYGKPFFITNFK